MVWSALSNWDDALWVENIFNPIKPHLLLFYKRNEEDLGSEGEIGILDKISASSTVKIIREWP